MKDKFFLERHSHFQGARKVILPVLICLLLLVEEREEILERVYEELTDWYAKFLGKTDEEIAKRKNLRRHLERMESKKDDRAHGIKFDL